MFGFCSIVVASLVSVTGIIGFVGLVVPHMARILSGTSTNRVIIPLSALGGGIYLIWADALARSLFGAADLPLLQSLFHQYARGFHQNEVSCISTPISISFHKV